MKKTVLDLIRKHADLKAKLQKTECELDAVKGALWLVEDNRDKDGILIAIDKLEAKRQDLDKQIRALENMEVDVDA